MWPWNVHTSSQQINVMCNELNMCSGISIIMTIDIGARGRHHI